MALFPLKKKKSKIQPSVSACCNSSVFMCVQILTQFVPVSAIYRHPRTTPQRCPLRWFLGGQTFCAIDRSTLRKLDAQPQKSDKIFCGLVAQQSKNE